MHSLANFHVKWRFSSENTVSASKRSKDREMHSLAKISHFFQNFKLKIFVTKSTVSASERWLRLENAEFTQISRENVEFPQKPQFPLLKDGKCTV